FRCLPLSFDDGIYSHHQCFGEVVVILPCIIAKKIREHYRRYLYNEVLAESHATGSIDARAWIG
ncbi:hypothetical protein J3T23_26010, partial [Salmonella enterica]